jgi:hypothetical protein
MIRSLLFYVGGYLADLRQTRSLAWAVRELKRLLDERDEELLRVRAGRDREHELRVAHASARMEADAECIRLRETAAHFREEREALRVELEQAREQIAVLGRAGVDLLRQGVEQTAEMAQAWKTIDAAGEEAASARAMADEAVATVAEQARQIIALRERVAELEAAQR